jgi:hypothetical protein
MSKAAECFAETKIGESLYSGKLFKQFAPTFQEKGR